MRSLVACLLLTTPTLVFASPFASSSAVNTGTFARAHALPELGQSRVVTLTAESEMRLTVANEFYAKGSSLRLDAETLQLDLSTRQPLLPGLEWGLRLPLLVQGGGALDDVIESWHSVFGLPNGDRENAPRNRYQLRYQRGGSTLLNLMEGHTGLGDVQASLGWQQSADLSLRALLQLPTGEASRLSGGHAGVAAWADWSKLLGGTQATRLNLSGGVSLSQTRGPLQSIQKPFAAYGRAALATTLHGSLQGQLSLQLHSALYDNTGDRPISGPGGSVAFGVGFRAYGHPVSVTVEEDALLYSGPDLTLKLGVGF